MVMQVVVEVEEEELHFTSSQMKLFLVTFLCNIKQMYSKFILGFTYKVHGGKGGLTTYTATKPTSENGGSGTAVLYHMVHRHRTIFIDNNGLKVKNKIYIELCLTLSCSLLMNII